VYRRYYNIERRFCKEITSEGKRLAHMQLDETGREWLQAQEGKEMELVQRNQE